MSLFGCSHKRTSFPITLGKTERSNAASETYIVCLDCGREMAYDWQEMKVVRVRKHRITHQIEALGSAAMRLITS